MSSDPIKNKVGEGSVIILGYGYRGKGSVVRPIITLQAPLDVELSQRTSITAEFVALCVFDVEVECTGPDAEVEFRSILESEADITTPSGDW